MGRSPELDLYLIEMFLSQLNNESPTAIIRDEWQTRVFDSISKGVITVRGMHTPTGRIHEWQVNESQIGRIPQYELDRMRGRREVKIDEYGVPRYRYNGEIQVGSTRVKMAGTPAFDEAMVQRALKNAWDQSNNKHIGIGGVKFKDEQQEREIAIEYIRQKWQVHIKYVMPDQHSFKEPSGRVAIKLNDDSDELSRHDMPTFTKTLTESDTEMANFKTFATDMVKKSEDQAKRKAAGQAVVAGKSASEALGKVPPRALASSSSVGTASVDVGALVDIIGSTEARGDALIARGGDVEPFMDMLEYQGGANATTCAKLVEKAWKGNRPNVIVKEVEFDALQNALHAINVQYDVAEKALNARIQAAKWEYSPLKGEHGDIWLTNTIIRTLVSSINRGRHLLLTGEPGTSKTDTARALAVHTERELHHMEVSGLSDVSQLEQERYIENVGGVSVTTSVPTALINALESHEKGASVILVIDEIARVTDPAILNPLMLLMSHGEFHAVVGKKVYRVDPKRFCIVATANIMVGYNFSGNSRRGMDDALLDRFRIVQLARPPHALVKQIISDRVDLSDYSTKIQERMLTAVEFLYKMAESKASDDLKRLITVRSMIDVADGWAGLDPNIYSLSEAVTQFLSPKAKTESSMTSIISALETQGW